MAHRNQLAKSIVGWTLFVVWHLGISPVSSAAQDGKKVWEDVIKQCADSDILGKRVIYMGPSNSVGPGSIWAKRDGGYQLVFLLEDASIGVMQPHVVKVGKRFSCQGKIDKKSGFSIGGILGTLLAPITGSFGLDLKRARTITMDATFLQVDLVVIGRYNRLMGNPETPKDYVVEASKGNNYVADKGVLVKGLSATFDFGSTNTADLRAKYQGELSKSDSLAIGLSAYWSSDRSLTIRSVNDFYVALQLSKYRQTGSAGNPPRLEEEDLDPDVPLVALPYSP